MKNIGLFIDGENINQEDISFIIDEVRKYGRIIINKVYLDFTMPLSKKWKDALIQFGIEPIHCASLPKKNSVDIKLIDDIYETLYVKNTVDNYFLVSSDVDFLTVCRRVRSFGKHFYVFGSDKCAEILKNSCDKFFTIEHNKKTKINIENIFDNL